MIDVDTIPDVDDVDMLDETRIHAACPVCYPSPLPPLTPFIAICGTRALTRSGRITHKVPNDACPDCVRAAALWWVGTWACCIGKSA